MSVQYPPFFLRTLQTALDDPEVVGFEQTGGWQKINSLLPLLIRLDVHEYFLRIRLDWVCAVQILFDKLKVSLSVLHRDGL